MGANGFGNADDSKIVTLEHNPEVLSKIARINIAGKVLGTVTAGDHFGFVAEKIGRLRVEGVPVSLTPGAGNDNVPLQSDVAAREVPTT